MSFITTPEGFRLRYSDRGDGARTILLVHGWKMSHRVWDLTVAHLEGKYRLVSFDLRGMGESDKPKCNYSFEEFSRDVSFIIRELNLENVTLVGWSMGCSVSLEYMKRDGANVSKLVLINGPIKLTSAPEFPWSMTEAELDGYIRGLAEKWPAKERQFTEDAFLNPDEDTLEWIFHIALQSPLDVILKAVRQQALLDHRSVLPALQVPVLAIYGKHDPYYPTELADYIANQCLHGQRVIMSKSAHFPYLEEAEEFEKILSKFVDKK